MARSTRFTLMRLLGEKNHTFAPWDSNLKTKKNASGKRPPDEAHGPGDETIRPQRSSVAWRSSSAPKNSTKFRQTFLHLCSFILKIVFISCNSGPKFTDFDDFPEFQQFVRKISKSPMLKFPEIFDLISH